MTAYPPTIRPKKWQVASAPPPTFQAQFGHINPILAQVLYNRGLTEPATVQSFLDGRYAGQVDPFLMTDMDVAVQRLDRALQNDESICVYGDFDADGVTATVLLTEALRGAGFSHVRPYIPDRVDEGYGINCSALDYIKEKGCDIVISVDCGIRSVEEAVHAHSIGLDLIVTDHHSLGPEMPPAYAVINPKRPESQYPETMLAGVGIAYKLAQAFYLEQKHLNPESLERLLDLVAIGTVADLAPLLGENRQLVRDGLAVMNQARRAGIKALAQTARLKEGNFSAETIGFFIGPRINAAGRLAEAYTAAKLLAAFSFDKAMHYAQELEQLNKRRQELTRSLTDMAEAMVEPNAPLIFAADEAFEPGIVGLVASRLTDKHYRPAVIIEKGEFESRASCRSIPEFHITDALDQLSDLLVRHGGHARAAGFTVETEQLPSLTEALTALAAEQLQDVDLTPTLAIDAEIPLETVDWSLYGTLQQLEPTGYANPTPVFCSRGVQVFQHRAVGKEGAHLQLEVGAYGRGVKGIAFQQGAWAGQLPNMIDIAYTVNENDFRNRKTLQLNIQDIKPSN